MSGASWYCISTAFMQYAAGFLVSVATYERDGVGTGMTDSLAYTDNANGNRTKEEDYDGMKALTYRIMYTWRDTQSVFALMRENARNDQRSVLSSKHGRLTADLSSRNRGMITIYDMAGKRISRIAIDHSGIVLLGGIAGKGPYIAVFSVSGIDKQTITFSNYN